ncbi:MAG: hypothetical protein OXH79_03545 [Boseongicola sp.]|nr:hypothetical protein [Boseongicola sp.]
MPTINIDHPEWDQFVHEHLTPGIHAGALFLTWHGDYVARFHRLMNTLPPNIGQPKPADVAPWLKIPNRLKRTRTWVAEASDLQNREDKLQNSIQTFKTLEELAGHIVPLHNAMHRAAEEAYNEPHIANIVNAPRSTYFWRLHGLVETWHQAWIASQPASTSPGTATS